VISTLASISKFKSNHYNSWMALFIGTWPTKWEANAKKMKCKCSLEEKLNWRPCDVGDEPWWCQVACHTLPVQVTRSMLPSHSPCLAHALLASKWRDNQGILGQKKSKLGSSQLIQKYSSFLLKAKPKQWRNLNLDYFLHASIDIL